MTIQEAQTLDELRATIRDLEDQLASLRQSEAEQRRLLTQGEAQRDRLEGIVESVPGVVWEAWGRPDHSGQQIQFVNRYVEPFLGYTVEEWISTPNFWLTIVHPEDQTRAAAEAVAIFEGGVGGVSRFRWMTKDGEPRWVEAYSSVVADAQGTPLGMRGVSLDITARQEAEASRDEMLSALSAERGRLQELIMQAPAAISISSGPDHRVVSVNPRYQQFIQWREIIGLTARQAFPDLEGQGFFELLDHVYTSGEPFVGTEVRAVFDRLGDGVLEEAFFNFVYQPLRDSDGTVSGIMTHAVEVTDQVRARQQVEEKAAELARLTGALERSNQELDQFAYVTSHDLKAPLRGIANLAQWLEEDLQAVLTDETRRQLALLQGRVHRMENLIDGILQYSRVGRITVKAERVDVGLLLSEVIDLLGSKGDFTISVAPNMPQVRTVRMLLQQVFLNLISNAIKHHDRTDGQIKVTVSDSGQHYEFAVQDDGPGIEPRYHEKIFVIFQTLEARDKVEGTGVGLALVKKIVEHQGGKIWVESSPGAGTTFRFTWPKDVKGSNPP